MLVIIVTDVTTHFMTLLLLYVLYSMSVSESDELFLRKGINYMKIYLNI